jgi:hypothetical protein
MYRYRLSLVIIFCRFIITALGTVAKSTKFFAIQKEIQISQPQVAFACPPVANSLTLAAAEACTHTAALQRFDPEALAPLPGEQCDGAEETLWQPLYPFGLLHSEASVGRGLSHTVPFQVAVLLRIPGTFSFILFMSGEKLDIMHRTDRKMSRVCTTKYSYNFLGAFFFLS